jgi:hypothetical protein
MKIQKEIFIRSCVVVFIISVVGVYLFEKKGSNSPSFKYFQKEIAPILASTCSAKDEKGVYVCHGTNTMASDAEKNDKGVTYQHLAPNIMASSCDTACHRISGKNKFSFGLDKSGQISTDRQMIFAYQAAKKFASYSKSPFAKIIRFPLGAVAGGFGQYHPGGEIIESTSDLEYQKLVEWVRLESSESSQKKKITSEAEKYFGQHVLPVYARNGCLSPNCHIFNHSTFIPDAGIPSQNLKLSLVSRFSPEQVSFNRMTSKGLIQSNVYLTGDVELSRLLKKNIPIGKQGILHRGGNDQFFTGPQDPDYKIINKWLGMERRDAISKLRIDNQPVDVKQVGRVKGVVFVRTKTSNHRHYLDVGKYLPGGDLYLLKLQDGESLETTTAKPINLTKQFHPGSQVDIREPDVRYDGRAILFAMRKGAEDSLNIYEIKLDHDLNYVEGSFRKLTYGPKQVNGLKVHYTDPTYVPDSGDTHAAAGGYNLGKVDLVFASNLAGNVIQSVERGTVGEADGGTERTIIDFDRPELSNSFVGRHIFIVSGTNKGLWRKIVSFKNNLFTKSGRSYITVDKPFPLPIDNSSIYVIEKPPSSQPGYLPSYSMYGIKYPAYNKEEQMYNSTISRITHGVAQEMDLSVRSTGEVFYAGQRSFLNKYDRPIFNVGSMRRHLDTRFSFPTHHGNRSQVLIYADNHEMPSGIDIHAGLDPDNLWEGGNLSVSDHQMGPGLEARNPNDYATGYFDEDGNPMVEAVDRTQTRYKYKNAKQVAHTRFIFKKNALFPLRGPKAVSRTGYSPGGIFRDPIPLPDGGILVSHSSKPINHFNPKANPDFDLYLLEGDPSFHTIGGKGAPKIKKIKLNSASKKGFADIQAYPIYVRMKPKINAARRPTKEHLIRHPGTKDNDNRPALYLERNFLFIDAIMDDPSPVGKKVAFKINPLSGKPIDPLDEIKFVRMVEVVATPPELAVPLDTKQIANHDPVSSLISNGIHMRKRIVGEAPIEEDGSIFIKVPSKTPMIIQTLNKDKMALRQEARHYFFAPNERFTISPSPSETFQTCGACMGSISGKTERLFGPVNTFSGQRKVMAIAKAKGNPPAYGIKIKDRISIDFVRDIQPVLNKRCVSCHSGSNASADLLLTDKKTRYYNIAYENLQKLEQPNSKWYGRKKYLSERNALAIESYLVEKIYGRELKAPHKLSGDIPHPSKKLLEEFKVVGDPLTKEEQFLFARWIDMGASFLGAKESASQENAIVKGSNRNIKKKKKKNWRDYSE